MPGFRIRKPQQGARTLVADFLGLKLDLVIGNVRARLGEEATEEEVHAHLARRYADASETLLGKVTTLVVGGTLSEDFTDDDLEEVEVLDERTLRLLPVGGIRGWELGELIFFRNRTWVLVSLGDSGFVLKRARGD